ncbi:MAG TPA: hypothetical protein VGJ84_21485 [Polyangiaceae bacterium]|jgi:hypothetical protein
MRTLRAETVRKERNGAASAAPPFENAHSLHRCQPRLSLRIFSGDRADKGPVGLIRIEQAAETLPDPIAYGNEAVRAIMGQVWPFGEPRPRAYCHARALTPRPRFNMHAKCVVVDGEAALITARISPAERSNRTPNAGCS